jgi:hypothetical protein
LRYLIYIASIVLVFFVAVGVGAMAALMLSQQPERVVPSTSSSAESITVLDTTLKSTSNTKKLVEDTGIETTNRVKEANPHKPAYEASFVHRATNKNSRGDYTYISDPNINGDPDAIVLVAPTPDQKSAGGATSKHNIGVWYEGVDKKKWAIFNQDRAVVPAGATFKVVVPPASKKFVHHAVLINTVGNTTYLDDPLTNGNPDVVLSVTQNWNPGGGRGVYNNHPIDVVYDKDVNKWAIYNRDDVPMPDGAAFNVAVSGSVKSAA